VQLGENIQTLTYTGGELQRSAPNEPGMWMTVLLLRAVQFVRVVDGRYPHVLIC